MSKRKNIMQQDILDKINEDFENSKAVLNILKSMESMNRGSISNRIYRVIIFWRREI